MYLYLLFVGAVDHTPIKLTDTDWQARGIENKDLFLFLKWKPFSDKNCELFLIQKNVKIFFVQNLNHKMRRKKSQGKNENFFSQNFLLINKKP